MAGEKCNGNAPLINLYKFICSVDRNKKNCYYVCQRNIMCYIITSVSLILGEQWEADILSVKFHIKRIIENTNLIFEELYTFFIAIEAFLKSKTLVAFASDIN